MVHERFIKKGDKVYGPYFYKSVRDEEGKVRNIYLGTKEKRKNIGIAILMLFGISVFLIATNSMATNYDSMVILKNNGIEEDRGYLIKEDGSSLTLNMEDGNNGIMAHGINDAPSELVVNFNRPAERALSTDIVAIEGLKIKNATVSLKKYGNVESIFYCQDYDFKMNLCPQWVRTEIPFIDHGNAITFTVSHFSAYSGGSTSSLNISDDTDLGLRYSYGSHPAKLLQSINSTVVFYANYTNTTTSLINGTCWIRFNTTGEYTSYVNMTPNWGMKYYIYNASFNRRGNFTYNVNCSNGTYDKFSMEDNFFITNTQPYKPIADTYVPPAQNCLEDTACYYNSSTNFTDDDANDLPLSDFSITFSNSTLSSCGQIASTGLLTVNCTNSNQSTDNLTITVAVRDSGPLTNTLDIRYIITAVNDAPVFTTSTNLPNAVQDTSYSTTIAATDEEDGASGTGLINFSDNATIFDINMTTGVISFMPNNSMVGNYYFNVTMNDSSGRHVSKMFNLTVTDTVDLPNITFACDDKLNQAEGTPFFCYVNVSDIDPSETITFSANYSFFNLTASVATVNGIASSVVNFTPLDNSVYAHWVNITVTDQYGYKDSVLINFTVNNTPDYPQLNNIVNNFTLYVNSTFYYKINATDEDNDTQFGETLYYYDNTSIFNIGLSTGIILFTPTAAQVGTHWVNITVNDSTLRQNSTIINFTIYGNQLAVYAGLFNFNITDHDNFTLNMTINTSDPDGDNFTFTDNATLFGIGNYTGFINFTANDSYVGTNMVNINITDFRGAISQYTLNFSIYNINDPPLLGAILNYTNESEGKPISITVAATDSDLAIPNTTEYVRFRDNTSLFDINPTTGVISFTPGSESNGTYWINITVNDTQGIEDSQIFMINITDAAYPPVLQYVCNNERAATEDQAFTCVINATDNDTYSEIRFSANISFFTMNSSNITTVNYMAETTVNFTPTYLNVGNYTINITATDNLGFISSRLISFNISSVNDPPVLGTISAQTLVIGGAYSIDINATDEESDDLYFYDNTSMFNISLATGIISFTPIASLSGTHWVNITVNDSYGNLDSQVVNFSIYNNSAPSCTAFLHTLLGGHTPPTNFTIIENQSIGKFTVTCSDPENEVIRYNWLWNGSMNKSGSSASIWNYNVSFADGGEKNLTLIVNDSGGLSSTYYWNVTVFDLNAPPFLYSAILNLSEGWDENEERSIDLSAYFYDVDNQSLNYSWYFFAVNETFYPSGNVASSWGNATGNWSIINDNGNQKWGQSNTTSYHASNYKARNFTDLTELNVRIKFIAGGSAGVCFEMKDTGCLSSQQVFLNSSSNITYWRNVSSGEATQENSSYLFNVSLNADYQLRINHVVNRTVVYVSQDGGNYYFMAYNISYPSPAHTGGIGLFTMGANAYFDNIVLKDPVIPNMTITISNSNITFLPATDFFGDVPIAIAANDGNHTRESNTFYLLVDEIANPQPITNTVTQSSSSTSIQTKVASLDIIVPSFVTLTPLAKTIVPVILNNSGALDLNILELLASTNASELKLALKDNSFTILPVGQKIATELEITAGLLSPDRYTILIDGNVQKPKLHEQAKIVVDVRERDSALKTQLKEQIRFTRDLFLQNPECLELNELLEQAQKLYDLKQFQQGLDLVQKANEGCKNYIAEEKRATEAERAKALKAKNFFMENWKMIAIELAALILAILLLMYYFKRRSFRKSL